MKHRYPRLSPIPTGTAGIVFSLLACRPVIAIGWGELVILVLLSGLLLGPILFKVIRAWNAHKESLKKKRD